MTLWSQDTFLNEHVPKDYVSRLWKTISDNNIVVEKKSLTEQMADSFFAIVKTLPRFGE